jgi:hypothetical protein
MFGYYSSVSLGIFCSNKCHGEYNKKNEIYKNEKNPQWKDKNVKYDALHTWVYRNLGKPNECVICKQKKKKYVWANKSYEYKRELLDWIPLCYSCHRKRDFKKGWMMSFKKFPERKFKEI